MKKEIKVSDDFVNFLVEEYIHKPKYLYTTWYACCDIERNQCISLFRCLVNNHFYFNDDFFKKYSVYNYRGNDTTYYFDKDNLISMLDTIYKNAKRYMQENKRLEKEGMCVKYNIPVKDEIFKELDAIIAFLINYDKE